jgi:hypothetical protein
MSSFLSWASVGLLLATSVGLLLTRDWRWALGLLAAQYVGVFWFVHLHWPLAMAATKLVTGWMATTALGISYAGIQHSHELAHEPTLPEGRLFRGLTASAILLAALPAAPRVPSLLPMLGLPESAGGLILMSMGLLHLGMTARPLRVIVGLLTVLAGFEIFYAAVEGASLVAALMAFINLGLALVGSYLLLASKGEDLL